MDFNIYIIGGGAKMVDFLNSVAMFANVADHKITISLGMAYGIMYMMGAIAFQKIKFQDMLKYLLGVFIFVGVLVQTKVDTYVYDPINPEITGRKVSNVPLGLAFLTSVSSNLDYALTRGAETVFSAPDDLKYSHSGMMIGQDMMLKASRATITDIEFRENLSNFAQQCVLYDIRFGHYKFEDVVTADNMWAFFKQNANTKSRAFRYDGKWETCHDGAIKLDNEWNTSLNQYVWDFAKGMFPDRSEAQARATLVALMPVAYNTIIGVSESAADILKQNMMINLFYSSVESYNMNADNNAAAQAYLQARADTQTINSNLVLGQQSGKWLIYTKTTLLLILVGVFICMAPFATLPGGWSKFLKAYAGLFFMIVLWGPIFAMLNYIQVSDSISETSAIATGLNALSQNGIMIINARLASQAASFFGYVPYISMVLTGIGTGLAHMMQSSLSASSQAGAQVANELTTGNISLASTQQGVHGFNSMSGNKFDTSGSYKNDGIFTRTTDNGNQITSFGDGRDVINTSGGYSKLDSAGLFSKDTVSQSLSKQGQQLEQSGTTRAQEWSERKASTISGAVNNSLNRFNNSSNGENWRFGKDSRESESARRINNLAQRFADTFKTDDATATSIIGSMWAQGKVGGEMGSFGGELGARLETNKRRTWSEAELQSWANENMTSKEFNQSMETLVNAAKDQHITESNGTGLDNRTTYGEASELQQQRLDSARADIQRGRSYQVAAQQMANSSMDLSQNYQQAFVDWLKSDSGKGMSVSEINSLAASENMTEMRTLAKNFMDTNSESIFNEWKEKYQQTDPEYKSALSIDSNSVNAFYKNQEIEQVNSNSGITDAYHKTQGASTLEPTDDKSVKNKVEKAIDGQREAIETESTKVTAPNVNPKPQSSDVANHQESTSPKFYSGTSYPISPTATSSQGGYGYNSLKSTHSKVSSESDIPTTLPHSEVSTSNKQYSMHDELYGKDSLNHNAKATPSSTQTPTNFTSLVDFAKTNPLLVPESHQQPATEFSLLVKPDPTSDTVITTAQSTAPKEVNQPESRQLDNYSPQERMKQLTSVNTTETESKTESSQANAFSNEPPLASTTAPAATNSPQANEALGEQSNSVSNGPATTGKVENSQDNTAPVSNEAPLVSTAPPATASAPQPNETSSGQSNSMSNAPSTIGKVENNQDNASSSPISNEPPLASTTTPAATNSPQANEALGEQSNSVSNGPATTGKVENSQDNSTSTTANPSANSSANGIPTAVLAPSTILGAANVPDAISQPSTAQAGSLAATNSPISATELRDQIRTEMEQLSPLVNSTSTTPNDTQNTTPENKTEVRVEESNTIERSTSLSQESVSNDLARLESNQRDSDSRLREMQALKNNAGGEFDVFKPLEEKTPPPQPVESSENELMKNTNTNSLKQ
ncbi:conjugal transfer protein TraG N-terminal domain-containing protein [Vibrio mediterranei]|uniref:conjugal transfer protein TraG N-terminal domain-containing protein n=1 Tax=Vibrio mediterranei TaxID=689 RepID=UPI001EFE9FE3|nr:conjugal transfer protein TraG N-terminal domain-containing protein [Vibrio mediterranei]MCG9658860.1 conjugal transfer protein TraG N-terminal domain-containing protein [Vibrio mediterranei]